MRGTAPLMPAALLAAATAAAAETRPGPAADYVGLSKLSCTRYIASYGKSSDPFWDRASEDVPAHVAAGAAPKAMPAEDVLFAVACSCRLGPTQTIGAAVDTVAANAEHNLTPIIPIGVPRQPAGWARAFDQWIEGRRPRPQWGGRSACEIMR